jgi:hypothetical protein
MTMPTSSAFVRRRSLFALLAAITLAASAVPSCRKADPANTPDAASSAVSSSDGSAAEGGSSAEATEDAGPRARPVWTAKLTSEDDFLHYSKEVGGERFTKLVIDLKSSATYYVDAELYPMHKDFIFGELLKTPRTKEAEKLFDRNYGKDKPDFLLCYLVHHLGPDVWSLGFWDGDKATAAHVRLAYARMKDTFYLASKVKFRPSSNDQEAVAAEVRELPQITNDALYKSSGYQPFHKGEATGKLRIVPKGARYEDLLFDRDEIVILPEPLTDITKVAGIVSETLSTPLAHVNLRAAAWDIPNVGLKNAAKTYAALDGRMVRFEAGATSATLRPATDKEIADAKKGRATAHEAMVPAADLAKTELTSLDGLHARDVTAYGAKTANLGEIVSAKLQGVAVPAGFGIPIAHYASHLKRAGLDTRVHGLLADPEFRKSPERRKGELEKLRAAIRDAPLDPAFVHELEGALARLAKPSIARDERDGGVEAGPSGTSASVDASTPELPGVFVRSSTNAEDLPGFSGAGLYDTVPNVRGSEAIGRAVKQVWASVWNLAAYEERELYGIDHEHVYGAVLVQIGVDATAAGVLVTAHPTDPTDTRTFTLNAKSGLGIRVVDGKKVPEIVLFNTFNRGLRVVSRSDEDTRLVFRPDGGVQEVPNTDKGAPVLTDRRVARISDAAAKVRTLFPKDRPLDIEWVLRGDEVFIVQSRPFMGGPSATPRAAP